PATSHSTFPGTSVPSLLPTDAILQIGAGVPVTVTSSVTRIMLLSGGQRICGVAVSDVITGGTASGAVANSTPDIGRPISGPSWLRPLHVLNCSAYVPGGTGVTMT